jgi:hypothetical protein
VEGELRPFLRDSGKDDKQLGLLTEWTNPYHVSSDDTEMDDATNRLRQTSTRLLRVIAISLTGAGARRCQTVLWDVTRLLNKRLSSLFYKLMMVPIFALAHHSILCFSFAAL